MSGSNGIVAGAFLAAMLASSVPAQDGRYPVPEGVAVRLEADRTDWLLGEECLLRFTVENRGKAAFALSHGGDIRGTNRHIRFGVEAVHEDGGPAGDPYPDQHCIGGPGGNETLEPGGSWAQPLTLSSFRALDREGVWIVSASHDLGWSPPCPRAELRLRFRCPSVEQATALVRHALASDSNATYVRALAGIRRPEYLPALREAASAGDSRAVRPLGRIATREATRNLVDLMGSPHVPVAREAALAIHERIPDPEEPERSWAWSGDSRGRSPEIDRAMVASWIPDLVPAVRVSARNLVRSPDAESVGAGAQILGAFADPLDRETLVEAFDRESAREEPWRRAPDASPGASNPYWIVRAALRRMAAKAALPSGDPKTASEAFLFVESLEVGDRPRPPGWEATLARLAGHAVGSVRQRAIEAFPESLTPECLEVLRRSLLDPDPGVCMGACSKAAKCGARDLLPGVLESMRKARLPNHLEAAAEAAAALGDRVEFLRIAAGVLDDPVLDSAAMGILVDWFSPGFGGYSMSLPGGKPLARLRERWLAFLEARGKEMEAGTRFRAGDGVVTRDLFPERFQYSLGSNRMGWPGEADEKR